MENNSKLLENIIVDNKIFIIRGVQVMIDKDLALLVPPLLRWNEYHKLIYIKISKCEEKEIK